MLNRLSLSRIWSQLPQCTLRHGYIISPNLNMTLWLQSEPYDVRIGPHWLKKIVIVSEMQKMGVYEIFVLFMNPCVVKSSVCSAVFIFINYWVCCTLGNCRIEVASILSIMKIPFVWLCTNFGEYLPTKIGIGSPEPTLKNLCTNFGLTWAISQPL